MGKILDRNYSDKYKIKMLESFNARLELYLFNLAKKYKKVKIHFDEQEFLDLHKNPEYSNNKLKAKCAEYGNSYSFDTPEYRDIDYYMDKWCEDNEGYIKTLYDEKYKSIYENEIFNEDKFYKILNRDKCNYCGITVKQIKTLIDKGKMFTKRYNRGLVMELDRRIPNWEYSEENTVACCYWCNNAKTDEFFDDEFNEIGAAIGNTLRKRLID